MYISLISLISRVGSEDLIMGNISKSLQGGDYEFVMVVDNKLVDAYKLQRRLEGFKDYHNIRNVTVIKTGRKPPRALSMVDRRNRIADNHNRIKEALGSSDFVFGFEDDTILPKKNALWRLIRDYKKLDNPGFIEGVQVGRWGQKYIGAWQEGDDFYQSLKPGTGLQDIDGGGFYCFLTPTHLYKAHEFKWQEPLGPDVDYTLSLRKQGYQNYIDWDIKTKHLHNDKVLTVDSDIKSLKLHYDGRWRHEYN